MFKFEFVFVSALCLLGIALGTEQATKIEDDFLGIERESFGIVRESLGENISSIPGDDTALDVRDKRESVFHNNNCLGRNSDGVCYGEITCRRLKGRLTGFCPGLQGACCIFYRTCGGRTSQRVSHFRNAAWPYEEKLQETCLFSVMKEEKENICGLTIELEKLDIPGSVGGCPDTFLWISGIPGKVIPLICGQYSGKIYGFNVTSSSEIFIKMKSFSGFITSWSITVRQIPCSEFKYEMLPQEGDGGGNKFWYEDTKATTTTSTTASTTTSTTTTTLPPYQFYSSCGVKGPSGKRSADISEKFGITAEMTESNYSYIGTERDVSTTTENVVQWGVPELTDSLFYKYQGDRSFLFQRITYGKVTSIGEFPWQVALFVGRSFHCGGSIISEQYILTAGHCVDTYKDYPERMSVIAGVWNVLKVDKEGAETFRIRSISIYPSYSRRTLQNDIAIIKLSRKIIFNDNMRPICLPPHAFDATGKIAYVTGWGRDQRRRMVTHLHKLQAAVITHELCEERWIESGARKGFITQFMLCMDAQDGDSCNGDSGGPTVTENPLQRGHYMQVGIVSFGSGTCTQKRLPGVYTKVSAYMDWIEKQIS